MASKQTLARNGTASFFNGADQEQPAKKKETAKKEEPAQKITTKPFCVRLPIDTITKVQAYAKTQKEYGEIGKVVEAAINEYLDRHTKSLNSEEKAIFERFIEYKAM